MKGGLCAADGRGTPAEIGILVVDTLGHIRYASTAVNDLCFDTLTVGTPFRALPNAAPEIDSGTVDASPAVCEIQAPEGGGSRQVVFHSIPLEDSSLDLILVYEFDSDPQLAADVRSLVSFMSDPASEDACMLVHLADGVVVQATNAALNVFARHRNAILGASYCDLVAERSDCDTLKSAFGVTRRQTNTILLPDGRCFVSRVDLQKISVGGISVYLRTFHDTSPRANANSNTSPAEDLTMQRFAGGIAHELNNVLTVLVASFEELREYADDPHTVHEIADEIETATARAKSMSHRLLSLSGRDSSRTETIQIAERIDRCVKDLRHSISSKHSMSAVLDTANASIEMDRLRFDQIIEILVSNACEAMPDGGAILVDVSVQKRPNEENDLAKISISDTGHGISPDDLPRVFDKFFTTRPHGMSAGLGLDTAKEFVESVNGSIAVTNSESTGTTITFQLPCSTVTAENVPEPEEACVETNRNHLVVVVDDEDSVRKYVRRCLEREGYRVLSARDGQEGCDLVTHYHEQNQPVSAIVSDMLMPRMGGPEMARRLNDMYPEIPFLFISGYTNERVPESISAETAFLHKPFAHTALSTTLGRLITGHDRLARYDRS